MASKDPFSGLSLSEQTQPAKLDQRLFTPGPPSTPPAPKPSEPPKSEPIKAVPSPEVSAPKATTSSTAPKPSAAPTPRFDLKEVPLYKASFLYTQEELEALEDLKLELRREYDVKVTKNELIRSALHMLLEDHSANGKRSYASRKIRGR